jgi:cell division protein FtsB
LQNREEGEKPVTENTSTIQYTNRRSGPAIQVMLVVFIVLFILFLWLNFVLTQKIESIGRDIQAKTEELQAIERQQAVLLKEISVIGSQERMADQAWMMGYQPQTPVYLSVAEPLGQAASEVTEYGGQLSASTESAGRTRSLWELLALQGGTLASETIP